LSRILWLLSGLLNLAGGVAIAALRWPVWQVQAPVDLLFLLVPVVGAANVAAAWRGSRFWPLLLAANALCGLVMGLFAAWQFESFEAGMVVTLVGTALPILVVALLALPRQSPS
jgi:hypothetical protein